MAEYVLHSVSDQASYCFRPLGVYKRLPIPEIALSRHTNVYVIFSSQGLTPCLKFFSSFWLLVGFSLMCEPPFRHARCMIHSTFVRSHLTFFFVIFSFSRRFMPSKHASSRKPIPAVLVRLQSGPRLRLPRHTHSTVTSNFLKFSHEVASFFRCLLPAAFLHLTADFSAFSFCRILERDAATSELSLNSF